MAAFTVRSADGSVTFEQTEADHNLLQAALRARVAFPYECSSGGCGSCRYTPGTSDFEVLWPEAPGLSARDRRKGIQLACQTRATADLEITVGLDETCRPVIAPNSTTVGMERSVGLTHDIAEFRFRSEVPARFLPGQYAVLTTPSGIRRCYSMSNLPNDEGTWEFQIKNVPGGAFTDWVFAAEPGVEAALDGPYGMAFLRPGSPRDVLCVAGGSGISPMISIARGFAADTSHATRRLHFFYGGRTPTDICGRDQLEALGLGSRLEFVPVVSLAEDGEAWSGRTGFVLEAVVDVLGPRTTEMDVYFAGPPPMADAMQRALMLDLQVPFDQIHFDRFF